MKYGKITSSFKQFPEEEPIFLLRSQDILAPAAVENYAQLLRAAAQGAEDVSVHRRLLDAARECSDFAAQMIAWQAENGAKLPD